jgi:Protein of unknown function (DUF3429)
VWGIPAVPLALGLAGLIPFYLTAAMGAVPSGGATAWTSTFALYAAVILSFLGGARWGLELGRSPEQPNTARLALSMIPPLYAWTCLIWIFVPEASTREAQPLAVSGMCAIGFAMQWAWEEAAGKAGLTPTWYPTLRRILSIGVIGACAVLAFG